MDFDGFTAGIILENRYQILGPLGQGGMGAIYLSQDLRFHQRCVVLKENLDRSPEAQAQFRLEAELLATLNHPHLPRVTDHFVMPEGRQFLVMDYIEGENLQDRVERVGPVAGPLALKWADQILDALSYLHSRQPPVIHRDVKPANIRITPDGQAVLVDFGLTKWLVPGQATATIVRLSGSPGYAPIEQYAGGTDQRSDLYALGGTLYFALTGESPPEAPLLASGQPLIPPRTLNPAIPQPVEGLVLRAMQLRAGQRYQSADEMRLALRDAWRQERPVRGSPAPVAHASKEKAAAEGPGLKRWGWALVAGLGLVVLGLVFFVVFAGWKAFERGGQDPTSGAVSGETVPVATTAVVEPLPSGAGGMQPTPGAGGAVATSTPRPTFTATFTPKAPPTATLTPTASATSTPAPPTPTATPGSGSHDDDDNDDDDDKDKNPRE